MPQGEKLVHSTKQLKAALSCYLPLCAMPGHAELTCADMTPMLCSAVLCYAAPAGDWHQQKSIADRHLRVYVRNVAYDTLQLRAGVRVFVAEAYDPADAPPAVVDPFLQGAALNAKPPKPPRYALPPVELMFGIYTPSISGTAVDAGAPHPFLSGVVFRLLACLQDSRLLFAPSGTSAHIVDAVSALAIRAGFCLMKGRTPQKF
jgi:hypothetical protein